MEKEEFLTLLKEKIKRGDITQRDLMLVMRENSTEPDDILDDTNSTSPAHHTNSTTQLFYALGIVVIGIGVAIFITQIWNDLGMLGRILITLGSGVLSVIIGGFILHNKKRNIFGVIFHLFGGLLVSASVFVILEEFGVTEESWYFVLAFTLISMLYGVVTMLQKHVILTIFLIANTTLLIFSLAQAIINPAYTYHDEFLAHVIIGIGAGYLFLAHMFKKGWNKGLRSTLTMLGVLGIFGVAGWLVDRFLFWEIIYAPLAIGGFFLAVYMKRKSILVISALSLVGYAIYITNEYFADSIGWPVSLIILGILLIALGYTSVRISRKYFKK